MAIIFIPGIKGTELVDAYALHQPSRWPMEGALPGNMIEDVAQFALGPTDGHAAPRHLAPSRVVSRPCAQLILALRARFAPEPVFAFGYDWRQPLERSARHLASFLSEVAESERESGRTARLRLVTYSMGGLVLRSALTLRGPGDPLGNVDRIVFIAPPFHGSLGSIFALVAGEVDPWLGIGPVQRKTARTFASVYQMTPSWAGAAVNEDGEELDLYDEENWQRNVVQGASFQAETLRNAEAFVRGAGMHHGGHSDAPMLDDATLAEASDQVLVICGSGELTPCTLPVLTRNAPNPNWFDFASMRLDAHGDGRVWMPSAAIPGVRLAAFADSGGHALVCRDERVIALTSRWLAGHEAMRLSPRGPHDPLRRAEATFDAWDGTLDSLDRHVA